MTHPRTCNIRWNGERVKAYADAQGVVRVWDDVAGHYTTCHSLQPAQERFVRTNATNPADAPDLSEAEAVEYFR